MSNFRDFDPEKPETWPEEGCWLVLESGVVKQAWFRVEQSLHGNKIPCWRNDSFGVVFPTACHPLATPDDGMVMVPEKLKDCPSTVQKLLIDALSSTKWAAANIWETAINHFKETNQ